MKTSNKNRIQIILFIIPILASVVSAQNDRKDLEPYSNYLNLYFDCIESKQFESAEDALKKALKSNPDGQLNPFLIHNLGTIQRRLGKKNEALASYTAALGQYPKNAVFLEARASLYAELGQTAHAIFDYSAILSMDALNMEALYQRGLLYLQMKNTELAEADFNRMLDLNPDGLYARIGIASIAKFRGDYEEAEKIYNYLIDKKPEISGLYAGRAELYLLTNKPGKASGDANKAIQLTGDEQANPFHYILRCKAKIMLHEKEAALSDLEKAVSLGYDNQEAENIRKFLQ